MMQPNNMSHGYGGFPRPPGRPRPQLQAADLDRLIHGSSRTRDRTENDAETPRLQAADSHESRYQTPNYQYTQPPSQYQSPQVTNPRLVRPPRRPQLQAADLERLIHGPSWTRDNNDRTENDAERPRLQAADSHESRFQTPNYQYTQPPSQYQTHQVTNPRLVRPPRRPQLQAADLERLIHGPSRTRDNNDRPPDEGDEYAPPAYPALGISPAPASVPVWNNPRSRAWIMPIDDPPPTYAQVMQTEHGSDAY